jgi:DoxX-like family
MKAKRRRSSFWYPLIGLAFVVTGTDKLFGLRVYRRMFRELGWPEQQMKLVGAAELAGGTLLAADATRQLGGVLLAGASAPGARFRTAARRQQPGALQAGPACLRRDRRVASAFRPIMPSVDRGSERGSDAS